MVDIERDNYLFTNGNKGRRAENGDALKSNQSALMSFSTSELRQREDWVMAHVSQT